MFTNVIACRLPKLGALLSPFRAQFVIVRGQDFWHKSVGTSLPLQYLVNLYGFTPFCFITPYLLCSLEQRVAAEQSLKDLGRLLDFQLIAEGRPLAAGVAGGQVEEHGSAGGDESSQLGPLGADGKDGLEASEEHPWLSEEYVQCMR
jgi:hypothetical protein